jgi:predicted MPP superfamily phosphohydrolase
MALAITLMLSVFGGAHLYLFRRLVRPVTTSRRGRVMGGLLFAMLGLLLVAGFAAQRSSGPFALALARAAFLWMAVGFYLLVTLGALDLMRFVRKRVLRRRSSETLPAVASAEVASPSRRGFLLQSGAVGLGLALPTSGYGMWRAFGEPEVTESTIHVPGLPPGLSGTAIVLLTDLHAGAWVDRDFIAKVVARTNALRPDLVAITGDLVDGSVARLAPVVAPLADLKARLGTYFVLGNHEYYSGAEEWTAHLPSIGVRVLRNERVGIEGIDLLGVDDWSARQRGLGRGYDLERALAGRDPTRPAILLAHQPRGFERAAERGVALQLSGHTHGGQIWPWTLAVRLAYHPYTAGLYRHGSSAIYVSRGCGFWGPPARVGAPPEIARLTLVA